jgi:hypothetical protein
MFWEHIGGKGVGDGVANTWRLIGDSPNKFVQFAGFHMRGFQYSVPSVSNVPDLKSKLCGSSTTNNCFIDANGFSTSVIHNSLICILFSFALLPTFKIKFLSCCTKAAKKPVYCMITLVMLTEASCRCVLFD